MTSPYTPRPALKIESGYLVFLAVQKRFPAFIRCHALHFLNDSDFGHTEIVASPLDFRNAVAKLSANPILGPVEGGVPLIIYLAGRGLEEDFKDLADEIQEDDQRLFDIPTKDQPIIVAFGDPDALEDQQLNSKAPAKAVTPPQPEPKVQPVIAPAPAPDPVPETKAPTPEPPPPSPTPEAVLVTAVAEPLKAEEPGLQVPPTSEPTLAEPAPAPPAAEPVMAAPQLEPVIEPEPAPVAEPIAVDVVPVPVAPPPAPVSVSVTHSQSPTALALGSDYFVLRSPDTSGATVVVWQARRLSGPPNPADFEILQPTPETYEQLIAAARSNTHYPDDQPGELVAIKIALRGSESELEQAFTVLRRVGSRALQLYHPNPSVEGSTWSSDFPAYVVEWVAGANITESPAFSEAVGLEICTQILELIQAVRQAAPDILPTIGLKPSNIIVNYDERGAVRPRLIDWNVFGAADPDGIAAMLKHLGETLADLFADIRPESYSDLRNLGLGKPGDATLGTWDMLTTGTRTLIRRVLRNEFEGDADVVVDEIARLIYEQRARWNDNDPLWQARLAEGSADKLNWLDIAGIKLGNLSGEARDRLNESRVNETTDLVTGYAAEQKFYEAVFDLRVANRRFPKVSFFRWALLANTAATLSPDGAYKRLRLDEALTLMSIGEYVSARRALEHGVAFFDEVQFEPENRERARDYISALSMCAQALALSESGQGALNESWNVEEAESKLTLAEDRVGRYERLAGDLLHGRDALCLGKTAGLRREIDDFYTKHGRYDPYLARRETTEQARRSNFNGLIERAGKLIHSEKPADWSAALLLLDRAASEFPDLWKEDHDRERTVLGGKIGTRKLAEGRQALGKGDWAAASSALAGAMLYPAAQNEAARLQAALWAYQRGELELSRNDLSGALTSFQFAAETSSELKATAEAQAQKARDLGGTPGGDAVSRELGKRFAEQGETLKDIVQAAASASQAQALTQQLDALKRFQAEQAAQQAANEGRLSTGQDERLQAALTKLQRDLYEQQRTVIRKAEDEQSSEMTKLMMRITDEHAENQKQALADFRKEATTQVKELQETQPDWFAKAQQSSRKTQEEQEQKIAAALKTLEDTAAWLRNSASKAEAQAESKAPEAVGDATVKELSWKVEGNTTTLSKVQGRLGTLMGLNILLLLGLVGTVVCMGAYFLLPAFRSLIPVNIGPGTQAAVVTNVPVPTDANVTQPVVIVVTDQPPTTAPPAAEVTLACADAGQPKAFYDCIVSNLTDRPQNFSLLIEPNEVNGFFYSVQLDSQSLQPAAGEGDLAPGAAQFTLGTFGTQDARQLRVSLACTSASGCKTTNFRLVVLAEGQNTLADSEVQVTTAYNAP